MVHSPACPSIYSATVVPTTIHHNQVYVEVEAISLRIISKGPTGEFIQIAEGGQYKVQW